MTTLLDARTAIHAALTGVMAWLSIILALPGDTFGTNLSFRVMASLATEDHWAMMLWVVATVGIVGLLTSSAPVRLASVLVLSTAHGALAGMFGTSNPISTATGTYGILAGLGYFLAWRRTHEGI